MFPFHQGLGIDLGEFLDRDPGAREEAGIPAIADDDLAEHLADDDLQMLAVDPDALGGIDLLDFLDEVDLKFLNTRDLEQFLRVDGPVGDLGAGFDMIPFFDPEMGRGQGFVFLLLVVVFHHD